MTEPTTLSLSIHENAHAFINEAVEKALAARNDLRHWQFAILHLVQSLELSLKSLLEGVHPVLVYENIDNPKHTVSVSRAISRLENPAIAGVDFGVSEKKKLEKAVELRNQITHSEFKFTEAYAEAKFFELFAFVVFFQARHLNVEIENIIPEANFDELMKIKSGRDELLSKAKTRIEEEGIGAAFVFDCPNCSEFTFVAEDNINTCYLCRYKDLIVECSHCKNLWFEWQIESFFEEIDYQYEEGRTHIYNDFGYSDFKSCPECKPGILEDIQQKRAEDDYHRDMEEEWYRRQQGT